MAIRQKANLLSSVSGKRSKQTQALFLQSVCNGDNLGMRSHSSSTLSTVIYEALKDDASHKGDMYEIDNSNN